MRRRTLVAASAAAVLVALFLVLLAFPRHRGGRASRPETAVRGQGAAGGGGTRTEGDAVPGAATAGSAEPLPDDAARRLREQVIDWALGVDGAVCLEPPDRYLNDLWNVKYHRKREQVPEGTITGVIGPKTGADDWLRAVPARATFHSVDLRGSDISARGLDQIAGREDIRVLILGRCPRLRFEDLGVVATLRSLEILVVTGADLDERTLSLLAGARSLKRLELSGLGITDAGVPHLLGLSKLEQLELSGTSVSRASLPPARADAGSEPAVPKGHADMLLDRAALDAAR